MSSVLLQTRNLVKTFAVKQKAGGEKKVVRAVDGVDMSIISGENLGLVGESGSGKSTMAKLILRLMKPDSGTIELEGTDILHHSGRELRQVRRDIQMVFQDPYSSLDPRFTIRRSLYEAMSLDPGRYASRAERELEAGRLLKAVRLKEEMLDRYPHEFSGGERQRIAIARALTVRPKLLILDEAVSSLDVVIQDEIIQLLNELRDTFSMTYFFITHNLRIVRRLCSRIAVMYQGRIVEVAPCDVIFKNPRHPYTRELLMAAVQYKTPDRHEDFVLKPSARLTEIQPGHFLLQ